MTEIKKENDPSLLHVEPVLAVSNVSDTISYWHEVLGFPDKWTWGTPPNHGGVSWHGAAFVQFSLNPGLAAISEGHSIWINVRNLEKLYALHQQRNAKIVVPIVNRPWGCAEYTVQEINGYYLNFSAPVSDRNQSTKKLPQNIRILARKPAASEHQYLIKSVGWASSADNEMAESLLASVVFAAVALDIQTEEVVGCGLLMGDNQSFYYIKDVIVHPDWQGKRIGTALMQALTDWLEANAPDRATVGLFTGDRLASFYRQFGFTQACGMYRQIDRHSKKQ